MSNNINIEEILPEISLLSEDYKIQLAEYYKSILFLSSNDLSLEFNNKDEFHGALVMSEIFKNAKKSIKIFTGSFSGEISNNDVYIKSLSLALKKELSIEIIFENPINSNSKAYKYIKSEASKNNIKMFKLKDDEAQKIKSKHKLESLNHFIVADNRMFRFETGGSETFKAICNFDDKENSLILESNFKKLIEISEKI